MNDETAIMLYLGIDQAVDAPIETPYQEVIPSLDQAVEDWITESAKSKSKRTDAIYHDIIRQFRARLHKQHLELDSSPVAVAHIARQWLNERQVSWATFNQRRSILSSFYRYAIRNEIGAITTNPIDRSTPEGLRDYDLLSIALTTGHRASELAGPRLKHLTRQDNACTVAWERCKGNEEMTSVLKRGATTAFYTYLTDDRVYGNRLLTMPGDSPVWLSFSDRNHKQAVGTRTISNICERYLGTGKVHATRHTAAVNMAHQGATLVQVQKFLGHKNAKTTSDYLEEQLGYENPFADEMEAAFGIE